MKKPNFCCTAFIENNGNLPRYQPQDCREQCNACMDIIIDHHFNKKAKPIMQDMPDSYRETMYYASLKNRLVREKQVTSTVWEDFTLDEVKQAMLERSPVSVYCTAYNEKTPFINITERIYPSHKGVTMYTDGAADKTPKFVSWEDFYKKLKRLGLATIKF